jgi:hypothetical protein
VQTHKENILSENIKNIYYTEYDDEKWEKDEEGDEDEDTDYAYILCDV